MKTIQTLKYVLASALVSVLFALPVSADQTVTEQGQVEQVQTGMIDINNANEAQLAQLVKVGPKKAQEIIRYREANGPFKSVDELAKVKGIGEKTVEQNRERLLAGQ
ncbi:ComEA family DNA-binding protein [Bermanella sp. WJH001]|uniref:ComEA family DNA-binding protein n=1 Tax=Bermanella sp. WJH001 TaxID=3048005 RepID=UPI0024BEC207|nr:helix-hairpin-helix domain-containing protein [Bermanella sp. WJH001]MDJ1537396.1 helix-hairpin-helix domain-containing protein [Bermanella sp. WJH001]